VDPLNKYRIIISWVWINKRYASCVDREFMSSKKEEEEDKEKDKPVSKTPSLVPVPYYKLVSFPR